MKMMKLFRRGVKIVIQKIIPPTREGVEHYDKAIPAEVHEDDFYSALQDLASRPDLKSIIEIGSSSGEGSTKALVTGVLGRKNPEEAGIHCLEISAVRFENLRSHYSEYSFVNVHRMSSVGLDSFPSLKELKQFYRKTPSILNHYTFDEVSSWLQKDIEYLRSNLQELSVSDLGENLFGIEFVRHQFNIEDFDLVIIDGGEFLGWAEYLLLKGANWICLDDINSFKCRKAYDELKLDPKYVLYQENWQTRNGWAIFQKI